MTYSIVATDLRNGLLGVGVVSGSVAVGSRVPWAKAGVAAVATQAYTNPALGPLIIELVSKGLTVSEALEKALLRDSNPELRQVAVVDISGSSAVYSGEKIPSQYRGLSFNGYACVGNLLKSSLTVDFLCQAFNESSSPLPIKIINALMAGHKAGGDSRGDHSAALLVVGSTEYGDYYDKLIDLRVDYSPDPINDLIKLYDLTGIKGRFK